MAELFGVQIPAISKHLKNIFEEDELEAEVVISKMEIPTPHGAIEGKTQLSPTQFYNLDAIILVGYRVNSLKATNFRIWATKVLKEYMTRKSKMIDKDWLFATNEYICDLRTVAVLVRDGKILVQRDRDGNEYALPGGHVKIGETLEAGLIRETAEEMGIKIECKRMLWSEECFWEWKGRQAHNIAFYYLIELCEELDIPDDGEFVSQKDNCDVVLGWMPIEKLQEITIYPEFLREEIYHLAGPMKHFVSKG